MGNKHTLFFIIFISALFSSCSSESPDLEIGFMEGKVSIGPLCPVETDPPNPDCQPDEDTYKAWPIAVYRATDTRKMLNIIPDAEGNYIVDLPEGRYIVDLETEHRFDKNLPAIVDISPAKTLILNIEIDTGIR
jgi:hypothetical protein